MEAMCSFHDLKLEAAAEPRSVPVDDKHFKVLQSYHGIHHLNLELDVELALTALGTASDALSDFYGSDQLLIMMRCRLRLFLA